VSNRVALAVATALGVGYVPEGRGIFPNLSVRENLLMSERAGVDGRRYSGPNDLVVTSTDAIYFTDNDFGLRDAGRSPDKQLPNAVWLVKDGMVLDPIRHRAILEYINRGYAPFRYRDMERLAAFQNRVFAKYARAHKLDFIDVARLMPFDPDLFVDAIHNTYAGERLRAWVFFQALVPIVERHLKSGAWPRKVVPSGEPAPVFMPRAITFDCKRP